MLESEIDLQESENNLLESDLQEMWSDLQESECDLLESDLQEIWSDLQESDGDLLEGDLLESDLQESCTREVVICSKESFSFA